MSRNAIAASLLASTACFEPYPLQRVMDGSTADTATGSTSAANPSSGMSTDGETTITTSATSTDPTTLDDSTTGKPDDGPAFDDEYVVLQYSRSLVIPAPGVLDNDIGDGLELLETGVFPTQNGGTIDISADGSFIYDLPETFWGHDRFTYSVMGVGGPDTAHIDILVRPTTIRLQDVAAGVGGFVINGAGIQTRAGYSVAGGGDVNGDEVDDIVIGAPDGTLSATGQAYVIFGSDSPANIDLNSFSDGVDGFAINGSTMNTSIGHAVALGDINDDDYFDVLVSDPDADGPNGNAAGDVAVIFGAPGHTAIDISNLGADGFLIHGPTVGAYAGWSTAPVLDTDGDGLPEVAIGAPAVGPGAFYLLRGQATTTARDLAVDELIVNMSGAATGDLFGRTLAAAGDVDEDGIGDVIIGAQNANPAPDESGSSYLILGAMPDSIAEFRGVSPYDHSGERVAGGYDINGDLRPDIAIGAPDADPQGSGSGQAYVIFAPFNPVVVELSSIFSSSAGYTISGETADDSAGTGLALTPDLNGDGIGEVLVGAPLANSPDAATLPGKAYVIYGRETADSILLSNIAMGSGGFALVGEDDGEWCGFSLASAGDVNDDGIQDIIIGAYRSDVSGSESGRVYVVYGIRDDLAPPS